MELSLIDWMIIAGFFVISIGIGIYASGRSGKNFQEYFLAGGKMSWWLLGLSMVATTFAADTPNLVTDIVRKDGVSGNWVWWALLLTGLLTVFVYAKLWKRSDVLTDLEFYETRYSGAPSAFLRGFRAIYLGVVFNCLVMAIVILAGIKIAGILLGAEPWQTVVVAGTVTVIYTMLGGLRGVILTDCFQFVVAMVGAIGAAVYLCDLPEVGGFKNLLQHANVVDKLSVLPDFSDTNSLVPLFVIPLTVAWWANWYPGAEPGGGGYVAQRMLGAKSESDATQATLLFVIAHYAVRPWPWIVVALASLVVFPTLADLQVAFPEIQPELVKHDLAYPAMLSRLPSGLLGIVVASLIAAFMSTISTHLNWGSSYLVHDVYHRFVDPKADDQTLVRVGRGATVVLMVIASMVALRLESSLEGFNIIMQIGAGTGLIYILRWFWWRINAFTEITGMLVSFLVAIYFKFVYPLSLAEGQQGMADWQKLVMGVGVTTIAWMVVTLVTRPTDPEKLLQFFKKVRPDGPGWEPIRRMLEKSDKTVETDGSLTAGILAMIASTFLVYSLLFGTGYFLYGQWLVAGGCLFAAVVSAVGLVKIWPSLRMDEAS